LCESGTREPRRRSEGDEVYRARRSANLKTCEQCVPRISTRHALPPSGRTRRRQAPARHPSQCSDPEFRCSVGYVSSTIASSALPPGRLIVRVLSGGCEASRATPRHAERSHRAHHSHAGRNNFEKQRSASIWSMQRRVWPIADANRALKAAIRGPVAKAATATLRYGLQGPALREAVNARNARCSSPRSVRDEQEQAASRVLTSAANTSRAARQSRLDKQHSS